MLTCVGLLFVTVLLSVQGQDTRLYNNLLRPLLPGLENATFHCDQKGAEKFWWDKNDWGTVHRYQKDLYHYCRSKDPEKTVHRCSSDLTYCESTNIWAKVHSKDYYEEHKKDHPLIGSIGPCTLSPKYPPVDKGIFAITDWFQELSVFHADEKATCDVWINQTVVAIRGDSQANFYHNLCDFVNLFLSEYIAKLDNTSMSDISLLYWEPERVDPFSTVLQDLYKMLTANPILQIRDYYEKTVCFKKIIFAVKPRTVGTFFFNQYLSPSCQSGPNSLMRQFSDSGVFAVLGEEGFRNKRRKKLRITMLSRSAGLGWTSGTRKILNEKKLKKATMEKYPFVDFRIENFDWSANVPFVEQLQRIRDSDILIGMHGAGMAHQIFLHEWGSVFEMWHCEDPGCYKDLASLMGLHYQTGEESELERHHPENRPEHKDKNKKFYNYIFDETRFLDYVDKAVNHVLSHPKFPGLKGSKLGKEEL